MIRELTCIECPKGCRISVDIQEGKITSITGFKCKKGEPYARQEIENPERILTATVLARGLQVKLVPVRTDKPIPKSRLFEAVERIHALKIEKPLKTGEVIVKDFVLQGVDLIATRDVPSAK